LRAGRINTRPPARQHTAGSRHVNSQQEDDVSDETRGQVIHLPPKIAEKFQQVTGINHVWGAIQQLRSTISRAEHETAVYVGAQLDGLVQHVSSNVRLSPAILDYALSHADLDDNGEVFVILLENGYTEDQLNADVNYLHYLVTLTGAPHHIVHNGKTFRVEHHEIVFRSIDLLPIVPITEEMSPFVDVKSSEVRLKIQRFGATIETTSLQFPLDELVYRFGREMKSAIDTGRTHTVAG
jgi:hypothetical protein